MCGIAGILGTIDAPPVRREELQRMLVPLRHRGPDGQGFHLDGPIGLAHARLSIIDLAGGSQPIHNEDRSVWVTFNGEIFNYIELRATLEKQGHRFYTRTDTEVLVHLYEQYGTDFVHHLNGQFAIALWDTPAGRLILCRDRAGILPLFYTRSGGRLLFSSEIKALLAVADATPTLDPVALDQIFTFWSPVGARTVFAGIEQLQPGQMLTADARGVRVSQYWDWTFPTDGGDYLASAETALAEELHALLLDATRLRLRADVPVGAYLSGGLDSSALTALMCDAGVKPDTYSIRFDDANLDEGSFQRQMIRHLGVRHHSVHCAEADIGREFLNTIRHTETPILRTAPVPMMLLSGLARSHDCKVVLTGEGSDEVLGGYDIFKEAKLRRFWARRPRSTWRPLLLKRLYPYLEIDPTRAQTYSEAFFGAGLDDPDAQFFSHLPRWNTTAQCKQFYAPEFKARLNDEALVTLEQELPRGFLQWHAFNRAQYIEAKTLMANYLLCSQGDRMLMANSVEGRFPFLDHRVVEFASRLPPSLKMKVLNEKYLLKRALRPRLPAAIIDRHKQPYRAPDIPSFFAGGEQDYVQALLDDATVQRYGYFDARKVSLLLKKIRAGRAIGYKDNMAFVGILSTQAWHHLFLENGMRQ